MRVKSVSFASRKYMFWRWINSPEYPKHWHNLSGCDLWQTQRVACHFIILTMTAESASRIDYFVMILFSDIFPQLVWPRSLCSSRPESLMNMHNNVPRVGVGRWRGVINNSATHVWSIFIVQAVALIVAIVQLRSSYSYDWFQDLVCLSSPG